MPTVCLNKWRWGCTRVTWSPLRPGLSPNVPKSAPRCSRTFCSHSPFSVSHLSLYSFWVLCSLPANLRRAPTAADVNAPLSQSSEYEEEKPSVLTQCSRQWDWAPWPSPALCHLLLSDALTISGHSNSGAETTLIRQHHAGRFHKKIIKATVQPTYLNNL